MFVGGKSILLLKYCLVPLFHSSFLFTVSCRIIFAKLEDLEMWPNYQGGFSVLKCGRPKAAFLFWFFGDFRCGALLFMVIHVIYKDKNR